LRKHQNLLLGVNTIMKNSVLSFVLAFLMLLTATFAAGENGVNVDINSTLLYFSGSKDAYDVSKAFVSNQGTLPLVNKLNSTVVLKFGTTELTHESNSNNKVNITNQVITLNPLEIKNNVQIKVTSVNNIEAGIYNGKFQIVNNANASQIFDEVDVKVLVPALEVTSTVVKDKVSDLTDTKLEKGQKFTVTVDYKNIADQTDLENLNVRVAVYKGDKSKLSELLTNIDGDDLEDDKDVSDLANGKSDSATFAFEMPFDIDDGDKFTVLAEVTGDSEDTPSAFYAKDTKEISASVADNKVEITKLTATPSTLACGTNRTKITAEVRNVGDSSEDVQLFLRNLATGKEYQLNNGEEVELDNKYEDEEDFTETVEEYVTFTDLKEGQNTYTLVAYYNDGDSTVQKDIVITSQACPKDTTTTTTNEPVTVVTTTTQPTVTTTPTTSLSPTVNPSYVTLKDVSGYNLGMDWLVPAVIGVGGLIIGLVVALLVIPRP